MFGTGPAGFKFHVNLGLLPSKCFLPNLLNYLVKALIPCQ